MAKTRIKRPVFPAPKNLEEAAEFLTFIGREQREVDRIQTELNEEIEKLKAKTMAGLAPHEEKIDRLVEGLHAFAENQKAALTKDGKRKTVPLPTGEFGWRITPPAVTISNRETVLANIKALGLVDRFIRIKEELDKEAMLKEPDLAQTIKGVSITQREEFVVKPSELEIEIVSSAKKLKRAVT